MLQYIILLRIVFIRAYLIILLMLCCNLVAVSQNNIVQVEYYVDIDPGLGSATQVSITKDTNIVNQSVNVSLSNISTGVHKFVIRAKDANGIWSQNNTWTFVKAFPSLASGSLTNITNVEYFIDTDPGIGKATPVNITSGTNITNESVILNINNLVPGIHDFIIRAKDANGIWSHNNTYVFAKAFPNLAPGALQNIIKVEYYIDNDPGVGNATKVPVAAGKSISNLTVNLDTSLFTTGIHKFVIRAMDSTGEWSHNNVFVFAKAFPSIAPGILPYIVQIEYYLDGVDPGLGNAAKVPFTKGTNLNNTVLNANINGLDTSIHYIHIRAKDSLGVWSHVNTLQFKLTADLCPVPTIKTMTLNGCPSITRKGITYTTSTIVTDTTKTLLGCDSTYTNVNINIVNDSISGSIHYPNGYNIPKVNAFLNGTIKDTSTSIINYSFGCMPNAANETVRLTKNNDFYKPNGVTALDIALTQSHILQKNLLNSPFKIIAADITGDGKVTALDIVYMKRLILGYDTTFTNSVTGQKRLWVFVDSSYKFQDTTNPFPFKDSIAFTGINSANVNQTFIGCKLGDVNWDWNPAVARPMINNIGAVELSYDALKANNEQFIRIPIKVKNFRDMLGMQFTIGFNSNKLQWQGIDNNPLGIETGTNHAVDGNVTFLWVDPKNEIKTLDDGSVLMELVFKAINPLIDETLDLNSSVTSIAAYDKDENLHNIIMNLSLINTTEIVKETFTVAPNPITDGVIHVQVNLKNNKTLVFRLSDITGRLLMVKEVEGIRGSNNITLKEGNIASGTYYLQAVGVEGNEVKKIIIQ